MSPISLAAHKQAVIEAQKKQKPNVVHLPVAPQLVARTRFSPPPPPRSSCLMVDEAMELLHRTIKESSDTIDLVAISGPGDPLATPEITLHIISTIKKHYPDVPIGLRTYGIGSREYAADLAQAGVSYVQFITDGTSAEILEKIYAWIRPGQKTLKIKDAVDLLIQEQRYGITAVKFAGLSVGIETTLYPGYNLHHIAKIASETAELGAGGISLIPYQAMPGVEVELESPTRSDIETISSIVQKHLNVTRPLIDMQVEIPETAANMAAGVVVRTPTKEKPNIAVVSSNGIEVDLHLGRANRFLIYGPRNDGLTCLLESRNAPEQGKGKDRWQGVSQLLDDCFVLLAASAGEAPRSALSQKGLQVVLTEEKIEGTVDALYGGGKKCGKKAQKRTN